MWRYLRNSAYYAFFRKAPPVQQLHQHLSCWDAAELGVVHRSSVLRSVWLIRDCLDQRGRSNILSLLRQQLAGGWYGYELGRWMLPLHALPALDEASLDAAPGMQLLQGLDVFGPQGRRRAADPEQWPRLRTLMDQAVLGAEEVYQLQEMIPQRLGFEQRCLFVQAQRLEPGAQVSAHRDALPFGGDGIATVVLQGTSQVRVGSQMFHVNAGDCYAIADEARYAVEHEVKAASCDRLSLTFRYGLSDLTTLPQMPGEDLRSGDRGGQSALWEA